MALNRDMEKLNTVYSEVDIAGNKKHELIRIRQTRGHEIIKSYSDLKNYFKGNLRLAYPKLIYSGEEIFKVQYAVQADREDIEKISEFDFNHTIRDQVKQEFDKFKNQSKELDNSSDDWQKKLLIESFSLPDNFDETGYNHLIKVGSTLYMLNWGIYHIDIFGVIILPPPSLKIILSEVIDADSVSIIAELSADSNDYKFEWEIDGNPYTDQSGKTIKINKEILQDLDENFKVKLRVRHSERFADSQSKSQTFFNPFNANKTTGNIPNNGITNDKNESEWEENKKLNDIVNRNEEEVAETEMNISFWDRFVAWWAVPDNRKKCFIALALLLLVLFLIFLLYRNSISGRSAGSDQPAPQTSQNRTDGPSPGSSSQQADRTDHDESGIAPSDQSVVPPSSSDDISPPVSGNQIPSPSQEQNVPAPPFTPRGNSAENDLTPNQISEIENSPESSPTKIGDIFCVESAGKVKVWMKLSGGNIYILDSYSSVQGNCSQYNPGN